MTTKHFERFRDGVVHEKGSCYIRELGEGVNIVDIIHKSSQAGFPNRATCCRAFPNLHP
jgi:hypothetical protein